MTAESHEMESVSSIGKDDDPDFVPKLITKKSRTTSFLGAVKGPFLSARQEPISEDSGDQRENLALSDAQKLLLQRFTGSHGPLDPQNSWEKFFLCYLNAHIAQTWLPTFADLSQLYGYTPAAANVKVRRAVYQSLALVAGSVENEDQCTLVGLVAELRSGAIIQKDVDDQRAVQMVFQLVGWLTALFDPSPVPSTTNLSLRETGHISRRHRLVRQSTVRQTSISISEAQQPIHRLLRRFGSLLPEPHCVRRSEMAGGLEAGSECIFTNYVSFHSLEQVLKIKLEWVSTLNQHLEFDQSHRILRVFRVPSLCRLMYRDREGTLLSRLYDENKQEAEADAIRPDHHKFNANIEDFLVEILLSYRLIFGRTRRSRTRISRLLAEEKRKQPENGHIDPYLEILCTQKSQSADIQKLYDDLEAKEYDDYVSVDEFPFLARRLIDLQHSSMAQNPHSLKRLWNDKRNVTAWFTTWAVLILGGGTLLFQVLQLVFQIYQPFA